MNGWEITRWPPKFTFVGQGNVPKMMKNGGSNMERGPHHEAHFIAQGVLFPKAKTVTHPEALGRLSVALNAPLELLEAAHNNHWAKNPVTDGFEPVHGPFRVELLKTGNLTITAHHPKPELSTMQVLAVKGMTWEFDGLLVRWHIERR